MCGITGIYNLTYPSPIELSKIKRMTDSLSHRGPDEAGAYIDDWIALGHRRLSIIDIKNGIQPIHNEDQTLWIVYNGEIFNYPELRQELIKKGHRFYTSTDTEVILHTYEEKGVDCLNDFNGQFAFAIWDSLKKELFLARDRVGILPLFYSIQKNTLFFASEIKGIFASNSIDRQIDLRSLRQVFTFWTTLPGRTTFENIKEVPPGHYIIIANGKFTLSKYWDYPFPQAESSIKLKNNLPEELLELLCNSIAIRLRADVPVGSYLSGGLDSTGITSLIKKLFNNELKTFGIEFADDSYNEEQYQLVAKNYLNVDHFGLKISNREIGANFVESLYHIEKPILRAAPVPLFLLSKEVNKHDLKVVLTGEGADEIFGGYDIFKEAKIRYFWALNPNSKIRPQFLTKLYPYIFKDKRVGNVLKAFFGKGLADTDNPFYSHQIRWENTGKLMNYFSEDVKYDFQNDIDELIDFIPERFYKQNYLTKAQYLEMITFMSGYLLSSQGDRVAMAHSVELRLPYLDHRIIEFMAGIPPSLKLNGLNEKYLLKKVFYQFIPPDIHSRIKNPYRSPIKDALTDPGLSILDDYGTEESFKKNNIFNFQMFDRLVSKAKNAENFSELNDMALAGILSTQVIINNFIDDFRLINRETQNFNTVFDKRRLFPEKG